MRYILPIIFAFHGVCFIVPMAQAGVSPLSINILSPVQFPAQDFTITGARISLFWGNHRQVYGVDAGGIGNFTTGRFAGMAVAGIFNHTSGMTTIFPLQLAGIANLSTQKITVIGIQAAGFLNSNTAESSVTGIQIAIANLSGHTTIGGIQIGVYNKAKEVYGFQIGLVNITENLYGFQIGLLNYHRKGTVSVSPILNFGF